MSWFCTLYIVVGAATSIYIRRCKGKDPFVSTICGVGWPMTWIVLIVEAID